MNGNANGIGSLKRMELEYKGKSYLFTINPESYDIKLQNRLNLLYTKAGAFIDLFGEGVKEITISGITGFKSTTGDNEHGYKKFLELKEFIEKNFNDIQDGTPVTDLVKFYNHTDGEAYLTVPNKLSIYRNVNQPLLYKYDIMLYAIGRVGDAIPTNEKTGIGNLDEVPNTVVETVLDRELVERKGNTSSFSNSNVKNIDLRRKNDGEKTNNPLYIDMTMGGILKEVLPVVGGTR